MKKSLIIATLVFIALVALTIYSFMPKEVRIRATTTTSLYATGLLDYLSSKYEQNHKETVFDFIPVGSGEALRRAENGDACMVFVHAPSLEKQYIENGVLTEGHIFAYNYFIIAGPMDDPAGIRSAGSASEAFKLIYYAGDNGKAEFVSRGDNSGTHVKELYIWSLAGLDPKGKPWYLETGSGMAQTLLVANERQAYVLSDIGTYLKMKKEGNLPNLKILYSNSTELINIYSVYVVSTCPDNVREYTQSFISFILGEGQELIGQYGVNEYGQPLFNPADGKTEWLRQVWEQLANS